jgi:hypothetical protein
MAEAVDVGDVKSGFMASALAAAENDDDIGDKARVSDDSESENGIDDKQRRASVSLDAHAVLDDDIIDARTPASELTAAAEEIGDVASASNAFEVPLSKRLLRFDKSQSFTNVTYAFVFLFVALGIVWIKFGWLQVRHHTKGTSVTRDGRLDWQLTRDYDFHVLVVTNIVAACLSLTLLWLMLQRRWEGASVFIPFVAVVCVVMLSFAHAMRRSLAVASVVGVVSSLMARWLYRNRDTTQFVFAQHVIGVIIASLLCRRRALLLLFVVTIVIHTAYVCFFSAIVAESLDFVDYGFVDVYLLISFFWIAQVSKHCVHLVVAGVVSHWYYIEHCGILTTAGDEDVEQGRGLLSSHSFTSSSSQPPPPLTSSSSASSSLRSPEVCIAEYAQRAESEDVWHWSLTKMSMVRAQKSFGTVCYASLFISPVRFLWRLANLVDGVLARSAQRSLSSSPTYISRVSAAVCLPLARLVAGAHTAYSHFNKYAFTRIIVYGEPFVAASHATLRLFGARRVEAILLEDCTSVLLSFCVTGVAAVCASLAVMIDTIGGVSREGLLWIYAFVTAYTTASLAVEVVDAAITTLYACFAEQPDRLRDAHPLIFHRFVRISEFELLEQQRLALQRVAMRQS